MTKLLVTGGAGFIGSNFVRYWRDCYPDDEIVVLDALTYAGNRANLHGVAGVDFVRGDIRDEALVKKLLCNRVIDTLVHFAAESHVDRSIVGPDAFIETNVLGTHALLKAAKAVWIDRGMGRPHRFHHISTDEVYGTLGVNDSAFKETTHYAPNSPYAATKAASDHLVRSYHRTFDLQITTSHCSNNYGPYQFPEKLIPRFLINALHGRHLPIFGDGQQIRDWLFVGDHCRGVDLILKRGNVGETYNIGGGSELRNLKIIDKLCDIIDRAFEKNKGLMKLFPNAPPAKGRITTSLKKHVADRPGHDRRYAIDETKIRSQLGFEPVHELDLHLSKTVDWYLANESWWQAIMGKTSRNGSVSDGAMNNRHH